MKISDRTKIVVLLVVILMIGITGGLVLLNQNKGEKEQAEKKNPEAIETASTEEGSDETRFSSEEIYSYSGALGDKVWVVDGVPEILVLSNENMDEISIMDGTVLNSTKWNIDESEIIVDGFVNKQGMIGLVTGNADTQEYLIGYIDKETGDITDSVSVKVPEDITTDYAYHPINKSFRTEQYCYIAYKTDVYPVLCIYDLSGKLLYEKADICDFEVKDEQKFFVSTYENGTYKISSQTIDGTTVTEQWKIETKDDVKQMNFQLVMYSLPPVHMRKNIQTVRSIWKPIMIQKMSSINMLKAIMRRWLRDF